MKEINLKQIYSELRREVGSMDDSSWLSWSSLDDCWITVLSWGPWVIERQENVERAAKRKIRGRQLHQIEIDEVYKLYPLPFQNSYLVNMIKYLQTNNISLSTLGEKLKGLGVKEVREILYKICDVKTRSKIIECFIRDGLKIDSFPIDIHVRRFLQKLGLPIDEDVIIDLCREQGVNPRYLNRMIYVKGAFH